MKWHLPPSLLRGPLASVAIGIRDAEKSPPLHKIPVKQIHVPNSKLHILANRFRPKSSFSDDSIP